ncbi:phage holin family protein [Reichenbachiella versicolor]|uniref:phage holin family protein n=1 Tax=Reichenbachiella versicolor TaxID=1821036 RepID=UPI000D6EADD2|nr:phage holin family protein [Reichenbachiella versicolor]
MADLFNFEKIKKSISDYVQIKFELFKLEITEHVANILAQVIAYIVILLLLSFVLSLVSMGLSFYLNYLLDSDFIGFFITAGIYVLGLIIVLLFLRSGKLKSFFEVMILETQKEPDEKNE